MELIEWKVSSTSWVYPNGSLMIQKSLGEEAYAIIVLTPGGEFYLESIPQYGGFPIFEQEVDSIQHALEIVKSWT